MTSTRVRLRLVIHGRVQGVAFRASTVDAARAAGVDGWVRNRPDGCVEAVLEGGSDAVERVARFCAQGPRLARVTRVERVEEAPEGLAGFGIR